MPGYIGITTKQTFKLSTEVDDAQLVPAKDVPKYNYPDAYDNALYSLYKIYIKKLEEANYDNNF